MITIDQKALDMLLDAKADLTVELMDTRARAAAEVEELKARNRELEGQLRRLLGGDANPDRW